MNPIVFHAEVLKELQHARQLHPLRQPTLHHGLSVLEEEVHEFRLEVYKKSGERDPQQVLAELIQIASCAQRTAEDLVIPVLQRNGS